MSGERLALLFDTGGGQALVTPPVAERIGCRADGVSAGSRMSGERVTFGQCGRAEFGLGDATYVLPSLAVSDLDALLPAGLPRLDGLLALDAPTGPPFTLELDSGNLANVLLATHVRVDSGTSAAASGDVRRGRFVATLHDSTCISSTGSATLGAT